MNVLGFETLKLKIRRLKLRMETDRTWKAWHHDTEPGARVQISSVRQVDADFGTQHSRCNPWNRVLSPHALC